MLTCSPTFGKPDFCPYCTARGECSQVQRTHTAFVSAENIHSGAISMSVQLDKTPGWRRGDKHYLRSVDCPC